MFLRKAAVIFSAALILLSLCSCSSLDLSIEGLISPPLQDGNIYPIQKALEASVGEDITLKYPISGEYRSAFSFMDVDGDGVNEALALYNLSSDGAVSMHLNVIDYNGDEWISRSDVKVAANGIEKITFCDLNNDTVPEIIVGWMIYGTVDKQVGVYSYDGSILNQRAMENYTDFLCEALRAGGNDELIVINLNTKDKVSTVKVLAINETGIAETGSAMLDGGATSYMSPIVGRLADGSPALYIDATKGTGTLTEIIWFEGKTLRSTYDAVAESSVTFRSAAVNVRDINGNGIMDIPLMTPLKSTETKAEPDKVYVTSWSEYDGKRFTTVLNALMNYTDGYYLTIPDRLTDRLHLTRKTDSRLRIFYSYDLKNDIQGNEVFRIVATTKQEMSDGKYDNGYEILSESKETVYLAKIIEGNELEITVEELKANFYVIKQGE